MRASRGSNFGRAARKLLAQLLIAEALFDAVAEGDAKSLGIGEDEIVRLVDESSRELLP
ncbi:MAG: hypothetical protein WAU82_21810 [Candidatus Binatus sp.]|uniref:hypothetical protein n=1 Tax=Candidatus Binatus sp. TaxID=2811406 RepID=UPI003BAEE7C4